MMNETVKFILLKFQLYIVCIVFTILPSREVHRTDSSKSYLHVLLSSEIAYMYQSSLLGECIQEGLDTYD